MKGKIPTWKEIRETKTLEKLEELKWKIQEFCEDGNTGIITIKTSKPDNWNKYRKQEDYITANVRRNIKEGGATIYMFFGTINDIAKKMRIIGEKIKELLE